MWVLNLSIKRRGTVAKEILDQTQSHLSQQKENITVTQVQMRTREFKQEPFKKFETSPSFSKVFSVTIGKRTRPSININLKENPRLIALSKKSSKECEENEDKYITQMSAKEIEPSPSFFKVFSKIMGKNNHK